MKKKILYVMSISLAALFYLLPSSQYVKIFNLAWQHIKMVIISMSLATTIGIMVGIVFSRERFKKYQHIVMYVVGLGQTIPSLAVLALAMSVLGIGMRPVIFALTIYTILPIARNTLAGIDSISAGLLDAARGMGLPPFRILLEIELPNAARVIMAGIRTSLVINIGTAALGALVGAGGLGEQIFTGISFLDPLIMLSGALPTAFLALLGDYGLHYLENFLIPQGVK